MAGLPGATGLLVPALQRTFSRCGISCTGANQKSAEGSNANDGWVMYSCGVHARVCVCVWVHNPLSPLMTDSCSSNATPQPHSSSNPHTKCGSKQKNR